MKTTHKMYSGTTFSSVKTGKMFKSTKASIIVFTKVKPSMDPRQHNAVSVNTSNPLYDWVDQEETVHVQ